MKTFSHRRNTIVVIVGGVTALVFGCHDIEAPPAAVVGATGHRASSISDAAHGGGIPHFYFLPPLVSSPQTSGTFDATLSPTVEICRLANGDCSEIVSSFSMGSGSTALRMDALAEMYIANWHTSDFALDRSATYRVAVKVLTTELGHSDVVLVDNAASARSIGSGDLIPLVDGRTLPIKFRIEQGAVAIIGAEGGEATLADGAVTLAFPPNALSEPLAITARPVAPGSSEATDASVIAGTQFSFQPSPVAFAAPVTLTLRYPPQLPPRVKVERLSLCRMVDGTCWPIAGSSVSAELRSVSATVTSFSHYAATPFPEMLYFGRDSTGTEAWRLHTAAGELPIPMTSVAYPSWTPDGSQIVYGRSLPTGSEIRIINADGTNDRLVRSGGFRPCASVSSDGSRILYDLGAMTLDGSSEISWWWGVCGAFYWVPGWVPGTQLAGWRGSVANQLYASEFGVWQFDDMQDPGRVVVRAECIVPYWHTRCDTGRDFDWSADGTKLALWASWVQDAQGNEPIVGTGLYVVNADGTGLRRIVTDGVWDNVTTPEVLWSPVPGDNRLIYSVGGDQYSARGGPVTAGFYIINADGTNNQPVWLWPGQGEMPWNIRWSPDGLRIAVDGYVPPGPIPSMPCLFANGPVLSGDPLRTYIMNIDGSGLQPLLPTCYAYVHVAIWRP